MLNVTSESSSLSNNWDSISTSLINPNSPSTDYDLLSSSALTLESRIHDCPTTDFVFLTYYYGLLGLLSVVNLTGNALVIQCLMRNRHLRVPGNYFIFSLACSDLCLGLTYPVYNVSHMEIAQVRQALGGWHFCTGIITLYLGLQSVSAYNLVGVAVTRFISIRNSLRFSTIVTRTRTLASAVLLWVILIALSAILYFRIPQSESYSGVCRYERFLKYSHIIFTCVLSVICPLLLMAILYGMMAFEAKKHVIAIAYASGSLLGNSIGTRCYIIKKEVRMVAMAGTLLGYFAFAWLPFVAYQFYTIHFCNADNWTSCEPNKYIRATVRLLLHSNSAVNFFIYSIRAKDFRDALHKDLTSIWCYGRRTMRARCNGGGGGTAERPRPSVHVVALHGVARQTRGASCLGSTLSERTLMSGGI